jgi:hypothetical protein
MAKSYKRRQKFVDRQVQGSIVLRTATYWVLCMFTLGLMLFVWQILNSPAEPFLIHATAMWQQYGPVAIASLLLLPILIVDIVGLSNRFAGPIYRLRRSIQQLANGEPAAPVKLRDNDFWVDFAEDFNRVLARVQPPLPDESPSALGVLAEAEEQQPVTVG